MDRESVKKLAVLARVKIDDREAEDLSREFESILSYVGEVKKITAETHSRPLLKNVFRDDADPHEGGMYTEKILHNAPQKEGEYIVVKKIL